MRDMDRPPDDASSGEEVPPAEMEREKEKAKEPKKKGAWLNAYSPPPAPTFHYGRRGPSRAGRKAPLPVADPLEVEINRWFSECWMPTDETQAKWDALKWWECHHSRFPKTARLAKRILATQVGGGSVQGIEFRPYHIYKQTCIYIYI